MMKSSTSIVICFLAGLLTGIVGMTLLGTHLRPLHRDMLRNSFIVEQEFAADRVACKDNLLRSVVHRWCAIDAESEREAWPSAGWNAEERNPWFALRLLQLQYGPYDSSNSDGEGGKTILGIHRADLAARLELIGQPEAAEQQWELAIALTRLPRERLRKRAFQRLDSLRRVDNCRLTTSPADGAGR